MKKLAVPALALALVSILAGATAATAFREKPRFAESGFHAVIVQGAVSLSHRKAGDDYWHARPVNEALVDLVKRGLRPVDVTALSDDSVLILLERDD